MLYNEIWPKTDVIIGNYFMSLLLSYEEQLENHVVFLRSCGLDVNELEIGTKSFIPCREINGEIREKCLAYKSFKNSMRKSGCVGIVTIAKLKDGSYKKNYTYGLDGAVSAELSSAIKKIDSKVEDAAIRARYFWKCLATTGTSDYLERKQVGSYGIRFRINGYGRVAIVPARDIDGVLWSYQYLNGDGTKRFPEGRQAKGMFHSLAPIFNGKPIGIAESYVTAATCYQLTNISCVTAFFCENLQAVAVTLRNRYPLSQIIILADNDRYNSENKGMLRAGAAVEAAGNAYVVAPDFGDIKPSKSTSDWNDLMLLIGVEDARQQLIEKIEHVLNAKNVPGVTC